MTTRSATAPTYSEEQIALAALNYENQEWLIRRLHEAFVSSERNAETAASELGISVEEFASWLAGEVDLTVSELRQLANTVDAVVSYRVGALKVRYADKFDEMQNHPQWKQSNWSNLDVRSRVTA